MALIPVTSACSSGACPAVYVHSDGDIVIQGDLVAVGDVSGSPGSTVADHEALVKIPRAVFSEAVSRLTGSVGS